MDVLNPEDEGLYDDYYNGDGHEEYGFCKKTHLKEFSNLFLPVFYSITCALGFIANLTFVILFIKHKTLRMLLPMQMVISDVLFTFCLPFWAVYAGSEWIFGDSSCKVITLLYMVSLYSSNLFVAGMSLQRFLDDTVFASTIRIFRSRKRNAILCAIVWLLSILGAAVHVSFVETQKSHELIVCTYHFNHEVGWKVYSRFQMTVLGFFIPFSVLLFCSLRYCWRNRFQRFGFETGFTMMFFILWFPYSVVLFLHALQDLQLFYTCTTNINFDIAIHVTESVAFLHVFLNPLLYIFLNKSTWKRFQNAFKTPREYLLEDCNSSSNGSPQDVDIELKSVQRYHDLSFSAERPNAFLPEPK